MQGKLDQRQQYRRIEGFLIARGIGLDRFGLCLTTEDALAFLSLHQAQGTRVNAGIEVKAAGRNSVVLKPVFMNKVGWLYLLGDLEAALRGRANVPHDA